MKKFFLLMLIIFNGSLFSAFGGAPKLDITNLCSWLNSAYFELSSARVDWSNIVLANSAVAQKIQNLNDQLMESTVDKERFISDNSDHLIAFMKNIQASNKEPYFERGSIVLSRANKDFKDVSIVDAICCNILINFIQNKDIDIFSRVCKNDGGNMFELKNMVIALINSINSKKTCLACGRDYCTLNRGSANDKNIDYSLYLILKAINQSRINDKDMSNVENDISNSLRFFQTIDKLIRLARMQVGRVFELGSSDNEWIYNLVKFLFKHKIGSVGTFLPELNSHLTGYQEYDKFKTEKSSNQKGIDEELYQSVIDNWQDQKDFKAIMSPLVKKLGNKDDRDAYLEASIESTVKGILVTPFLQYYFKTITFKEEVIPDQYKPYIQRFFKKVLDAGKFAADSVINGTFKVENFKTEIEADIEEHGRELIKFYTRPNRTETKEVFRFYYAQTRANLNVPQIDKKTKKKIFETTIQDIKEINEAVGKYVEGRLTKYIDELFEIAEKARKDEAAPEKKAPPATMSKPKKGIVPLPQAKPGLVSLVASLAVLS